MYHFTFYYLDFIKKKKKKKTEKIGQTYLPKKSVSYIGHRLAWFLNIGIGQRKNLYRSTSIGDRQPMRLQYTH